MFVAHLQIDVGDSITAPEVKRIVAFVEMQQWPAADDAQEDRKEACKNITTLARKEGLFGYQAAFVNCGMVADLVNATGDLRHNGYGLIVNTRLQTPTVFYVVDDFVRVPHLNFDFPDHARFLFDDNRLRLMDLNEVDKTLLRLSNNPRKQTLENGSVVEQIKR